MPITPNLAGEALTYVRNGFVVFPCRPRGKEPLTKHGFKDATRDEAQIRSWWTKWPDANIGLPTGEVNEIIVVDPDGERGEKRLAELEWQSANFRRRPKARRGKAGTCFSSCPKAAGRFQAARGMDSISAPTAAMSSRRRAFTRTARGTSGSKKRPKSSHLRRRRLLDFARDRKAVLKPLNGARAAETASGGLTGETRAQSREGNANGNRAAFPTIHAPAPEPWSEIGEARLRSALGKIPAGDRESIWLKVGFTLYDLAAADLRWPGRALVGRLVEDPPEEI